MTFGKKIIELRKEAKLSQTDFSKRVGVHKNVLGKYERDEVKPSIDVATKIAKELNVSLDYLVGTTDINLNPQLISKIKDLQKLDEKVQNHILYAFEAMVRDAYAQQAYR